MATTRASGYVVTASVWNAVLNKLTDDGNTYSGAFNGSSVAGTTGSFSSTLAVTGVLTASGGITTPAITVTNLGSAAAGKIGVSSNRLALCAGSSGAALVSSGGSDLLAVDASGNATITGRVAATLQPSFLVYNSSDDAGLFSGATADWDTEVSDPGAKFASDTYTVPVTGIYASFGAVRILNSSGGVCTGLTASLVVNGTTFWPVGGMGTLANGERASLPLSGMIPLTAADTVTVVVTASAVGGSGFTIEGGATGTIDSHWGMRLVI